MVDFWKSVTKNTCRLPFTTEVSIQSFLHFSLLKLHGGHPSVGHTLPHIVDHSRSPILAGRCPFPFLDYIQRPWERRKTAAKGRKDQSGCSNMPCRTAQTKFCYLVITHQEVATALQYWAWTAIRLSLLVFVVGGTTRPSHSNPSIPLAR